MAAPFEPSSLDPADLAACRALLRVHARSFHAASMLLPPSVRAPASVLYGFCRVADDIVDEQGGRCDAIAQLHRRLDDAYRGTPQNSPIDRALAHVLGKYEIPRLLPERLIEGLAWDAEGRTYETLEDVMDYAARVAGTVGAMMTLLMGARSTSALARACDLGVAMQLSNIARDVAEDARMGRIYLPLRWMRDAGIDPDAWLARPEWSDALGGLVRRLLAEADRLYARGAAGTSELPLACRPGINAARLLYAAIGHRVARAGAVAMQRRTAVPGREKAWLLARAMATPWPMASGRHEPPLAATRALVQAAARDDDGAPGVDGVMDMFLRLGERDRMARQGQGAQAFTGR